MQLYTQRFFPPRLLRRCPPPDGWKGGTRRGAVGDRLSLFTVPPEKRRGILDKLCAAVDVKNRNRTLTERGVFRPNPTYPRRGPALTTATGLSRDCQQPIPGPALTSVCIHVSQQQRANMPRPSKKTALPREPPAKHARGTNKKLQHDAPFGSRFGFLFGIRYLPFFVEVCLSVTTEGNRSDDNIQTDEGITG